MEKSKIQQKRERQRKTLFWALGKIRAAGADITKEDMVSNITHGKTTKLSDLKSKEWDELLEYTGRLLHEFGISTQYDVNDVKRKRVISHLKESGYTLPNGKADMPAIEAWVRKQKFGKSLNQHTNTELSALIYAAQQVRDHYFTKIR